MCDQVYVGQTGRNFRTRYEEHTNDIRLSKDKSRYALNILQQNHKYGPIDKTMDILRVASKSKYLDVLERLYIYKTAKCKQVLNEQYVGFTNVLFNLILDYDKTRKSKECWPPCVTADCVIATGPKTSVLHSLRDSTHVTV
jgi:hypothetical protein